ncbi:hypothetical protein [Georgenia subflava]|uniref:Nudix hydrolase domain-containing protein n=1 Tax=Georgenia subflava TaxID=1622177 RepID=A0A6N7EK08_9MICO|nr:hypothetical protein [Georgenia subflava]MPV38400.1 hypothetical protein [Georgenia subflava]
MITSEVTYVAAAFITLVGLLPLIPGWSVLGSAVVTGIGVVLGLLLLVSDTRHLVRRWSGWEFRRREPAFERSDLPPVPGLPVAMVLDRGVVATDDDVNRHLRHAVQKVVWRAEPYRLEGDLRQAAPYVLRRSTSSRLPFNGPCVRLETDIDADLLRDDGDVFLRPASFFDALCSNELTAWAIDRWDKPWRFREEFLLDSHGGVRPLDQSELANVVGVSTLAITSDDHLLIVLQSRRSSASAELWAPSGSGSLEPRDVVADVSTTLQEVVTKGAERELVEECGIRPASIVASTVLGFGRWLDRGAKPEFVCLTALDLSSAEVVARPARTSDEKLWTTRVETLPLSLSAVPGSVDGDDAARRDAVKALVDGDARLAGSTSVPLAFGLACLVTALEDRPELLEDLRAGATRTRGLPT